MAILAVIALMMQDIPVDTNRPVPTLRTGAAMRRVLKNPIQQAGWRDVPVRGVLNDLSKGAKIAILLDRRVDPTQKITAEFQKVDLQFALDRVANIASARVTVIGNVIYVGPEKAVAEIETSSKKRRSETLAITRRLSRERRSELTGVRTVHWNDLDAPRDLIAKLGKDLDLKIDGLDKVPHDLWAGNTLPSATLSEALTLILGQFELTFRWKANATGIEIIPISAGKESGKR